MSAISEKFLHKKELYILFMMLETLHFSIWLDFGSIISRSFMLSHLGLFLIWQPVWRGDEKLSIENTIIFFVFTLTLIIWLNLWLLFAWLILLIGFVSGRATHDRTERTIYLLALSFLVFELLFACIPEFANIKIAQIYIFKTVLPVIPLLILFFPPPRLDRLARPVDFIHALTASMLTSLVALGSLLTMFISETTYFTALTQTSIAIGGFILCISWLLTSKSRFGGVTQLWSSYMLNIGTPFEEWLSELSKINDKELSPDEFLHGAMKKLVDFNWISGVRWQLNSIVNTEGIETGNKIEIEKNELIVTIFTFSPAGAALKLHCNLLIQLLNIFYLGKHRESELTKQAHLRAIYETGARITHDIKNLLQSLQAITSIITHDSSNTNSEISQQVLKRQLPNLTQRLQLALDKLQTPQIQDTNEVYLKDWWGDLKKRNAHTKIIFQADINGDPTVPVDLFDSILDNLLENIQTKQINEHDIKTTITLSCNTNLISIVVCDSGSMIPEAIANDLLKNAIKSDNGLGIGLYQANKHAEIFDYKLSLINNQNGRVCFELKNID